MPESISIDLKKPKQVPRENYKNVIKESASCWYCIAILPSLTR